LTEFILISIQKEYKINFANINYFLILAASATPKTSCRWSRTQRGIFAITCLQDQEGLIT